jgi:DNA-binding HxlR family transcriptional regulator
VTPTVPPRVDYELTPLGASLLEPMYALGAWANKHADEIGAAQARFDEVNKER